MPRTARRLSETHLYHVMLRGNEQRQIFQDEEDNLKFISLLKDIKEISGFQMYAYCLMGNHVHMLIRTGINGEPLSELFRRFGAQYVYWYNGKHRRIGHLFQDRYKSEVVEDDEYMLAVMRYIHRNPLNAGITVNIEEYPYSSYSEYLEPKTGQLTDTEFIMSIIGREKLIAFHNEWDALKYLEIKPIHPRVSDEHVRKLIEEIANCNSIEEFQLLSNTERTEAIRKLMTANAAYRQISRLTGESFYLIQRLGQSSKNT